MRWVKTSYFFLPSICVLTLEISKILFSLHEAMETSRLTLRTRSGIGALKVPFSTKMTKMPLVNPRLTKVKRYQNPPKTTFFMVFGKPELLRDFCQL